MTINVKVMERPVREVSYQTIRERLAKMEREGLVERRTFDRQTLWQVVGWDAPPQAEPLLILPSHPKVPSSEGPTHELGNCGCGAGLHRDRRRRRRRDLADRDHLSALPLPAKGDAAEELTSYAQRYA